MPLDTNTRNEATRRFENQWWLNRQTRPEDIANCHFSVTDANNAELLRVLSQRNVELSRIVVRVTTEFSRAWTAVLTALRDRTAVPPRPRIETLLSRECQTTDVPQKRLGLFLDLYSRELQFRIRAGDMPTIAEYRTRFPQPEWREHVSAVFERATQAFSVRFCVLSPIPLATGGQAIILHGFDEQLQREVALKRVKVPGNNQAEERLRREARTLAQLARASVPVVYGIGALDGTLCLAQDLLLSAQQPDSEGRPQLARPFAELVRRYRDGVTTLARRGNREFIDLLTILIDISRTISVAHQHSFRILHRDINPNNVLIDDLGQAMVIDWGLAVWLNREGVAAQCDAPIVEDMTSVSRGGGTPGYLSPEQAQPAAVNERNAVEITRAADVFSLGACLFELLTGYRVYDCVTWPFGITRLRAPREGQRVAVWMQRAENYRKAPNPRAVARRVDRELADIARRAIAPNPKDRYETALEFTQALEDWVRDTPPRQSTGTSFWQRMRQRRYAIGRWIRRNTGKFVLATIVGIVASTGYFAMRIPEVYFLRAEFKRQHASLDDLVSALDVPHSLQFDQQHRSEHLAKTQQQLNQLVLTYEHSRSLLDHLHKPATVEELLAQSRLKVAKLHKDSGKFDTAIAILREAEKQLKGREEFRQLLAEVHFELGDAISDTGDYRTAIKEYDTAETIWNLVDPKKSDYLAERSRVQGYRGDSRLKLLATDETARRTEGKDQLEKARRDYYDSLKQRRTLLKNTAPSPNVLLQIAHAHNNNSRADYYQLRHDLPGERRPIQLSLNDHKCATLHQEAAIHELERLNSSRVAILRAKHELAETLRETAETYFIHGQLAEARSYFRDAHALQLAVTLEYPRAESRRSLVQCQLGLCRVNTESDLATAKKLLTDAEATLASLKQTIDPNSKYCESVSEELAALKKKLP